MGKGNSGYICFVSIQREIWENFCKRETAQFSFQLHYCQLHIIRNCFPREKEDYAIYAESPFDVEHRLLMVGGDVSTKYTRRNEEMYQRYARYLWKLANGKKGNYLVFFPSYRFLEDVYEAFEKIQEKRKS